MATLQAGPETQATAPEERSWHALPALEATRELHVDVRVGLDDDDAARRLAEVGPNTFTEAAPEPRWRAFLRQYRDSMQLVLLGAGIGSLALGELATGLVVL